MAIRVLYLHHVEQLSGAENSLRLLLRHLDRRRVMPLFAGPTKGPFPDALAKDGVTLLPVSFGALRNLPGLFRSVCRLRDLIREHDIHLVHANGPQTNICAGLAGRLTGVPAVWHMRNLLYGGMWDVDRAFSKLATRIICNSGAIRERFRGSQAWSKSAIIFNAVDLKEFNPDVSGEAFRRDLRLLPGEPVIGMVGRIGLGKGHEYFIEAAVTLLSAGVGGEFLVVGDTLFLEDAWRSDALRRRVAQAGYANRIHFVGFRNDIPQVMRGLDVLVLASEAEPCGRVLFEAMASGTAVIATKTGGTPEIVRDGEEGLLVSPRDAQALTQAIGRLIKDPGFRAYLGGNGVSRVRSEFTIERYVARTVEVYEQLVSL